MDGIVQDDGFVKIYRRLWDHPIFASWVEAAIFAWMVSVAQWRPATIGTKLGPVELGVGELIIAERVLSERFLLHRNVVRKVIERLFDNEVIEVFRDRAPHRVGTVVRIVKYEQYQSDGRKSETIWDRSGTEDGTEVGQKRDRSGTKNNERKERKERKGKKEEYSR